MAAKLSPLGKAGRDGIKAMGVKANGSKTGLNYVQSVGVGRSSKKK